MKSIYESLNERQKARVDLVRDLWDLKDMANLPAEQFDANQFFCTQDRLMEEMGKAFEQKYTSNGKHYKLAVNGIRLIQELVRRVLSPRDGVVVN